MSVMKEGQLCGHSCLTFWRERGREGGWEGGKLLSCSIVAGSDESLITRPAMYFSMPTQEWQKSKRREGEKGIGKEGGGGGGGTKRAGKCHTDNRSWAMVSTIHPHCTRLNLSSKTKVTQIMLPCKESYKGTQ